MPGDHGGYEDEQADGRVHQGDLLQTQQEEGALHRALGPKEVRITVMLVTSRAVNETLRNFPLKSRTTVCFKDQS